MGFSPLLPLTLEALREHVPSESGVYEIRLAAAAPGACPIIYLGSTHDLHKRLANHLRGGWSDNVLLQAYVQGGVRFRYRRVTHGWREVERAVYRAFCATFGVPPSCNRMSP